MSIVIPTPSFLYKETVLLVAVYLFSYLTLIINYLQKITKHRFASEWLRLVINPLRVSGSLRICQVQIFHSLQGYYAELG